MLKAIVFDCDGVLVDTEHLKFLAWEKALAKQGIEYTLPEYIQIVGYDSPYILEKISKEHNKQLSGEVIATKEQYYQELRENGVIPIASTVALAKDIAGKKKEYQLKLGLASSDYRKNILSNLEKTRLSTAFDAIVSGHDDLGAYDDADGKNKPKPYIYQEAAKRLGFAPSECLAFEDTAAGVEAASRAGFIVIAIPNEFTKYQDFSKADFILEQAPATLEELLSIVGDLYD